MTQAQSALQNPHYKPPLPWWGQVQLHAAIGSRILILRNEDLVLHLRLYCPHETIPVAVDTAGVLTIDRPELWFEVTHASQGESGETVLVPHWQRVQIEARLKTRMTVLTDDPEKRLLALGAFCPHEQIDPSHMKAGNVLVLDQEGCCFDFWHKIKGAAIGHEFVAHPFEQERCVVCNPEPVAT